MFGRTISQKSLTLHGPRPRNIDLNRPIEIPRLGRKFKPKERDLSGPAPIERTQSWEWKEAQRDPSLSKCIHEKLPQKITISNSYFGIRKPRKFPSKPRTEQGSVFHPKPFYPPGVPKPLYWEEQANRVAFARWIYRQPVRGRIRAHSVPNRSIPNTEFGGHVDSLTWRRSYDPVRFVYLNIGFIFVFDFKL